jgi:predicted RNase H-like HicB family nuclease
MKVPDGYIAFVEELPGANTQDDTLEEARMNLEESVTMVLDANREISEQSPGRRRDSGKSHPARRLEQHDCELHRHGGNPLST